MGTVLNIRQTDDPRDVIHQAVQALSDGKLVVLPTETAYVLAGSPLQPDWIDALRSQPGTTPLTLALKSCEEAMDYLPMMCELGQKFARRSWPGPVTLSVRLEEDRGILDALPAEVRQLLPEGRLHLRVPHHEIVQEILRLTPGPLVIAPETPESPTTAQEAVERYGHLASLIVDDGSTRYGQPSTMVEIHPEQQWQILQPGVVSEQVMKRLSSTIIVFVCTGNTCRSPMAEVIFKRKLSEKLGCAEDELMDHGFIVTSAGLAAYNGGPAAQEAVELLQLEGLDLSQHVSQQMTEQLLDQSDRIYAMTRGHREAILSQRPDLADRVLLLSAQGKDVSDPIGGGMEQYIECKQELEQHIQSLLRDFPAA